MLEGLNEQNEDYDASKGWIEQFSLKKLVGISALALIGCRL